MLFRSLNDVYDCMSDFLNSLIGIFDTETKAKAIRDMLTLIIQKDICHCLFVELLRILKKTIEYGNDCITAFDEMNIYKKLKN